MINKKVVAMIPVRMASSRFPGKPLAKILGLEMVEHVRRRVELCKSLNSVFVATCDCEIRDSVERYGGRVIMTSDVHERCTDRIAEAASKIDADIVINIQGDEPMIVPDVITLLVNKMLQTNAKVINLLSAIDNKEDFNDPNVVKTVCDVKGNVLYFSREPIPSLKRTTEAFTPLKQLGIIGFTKEFLVKFSKLTPTPLEIIESIDMLRIIEHGYAIGTLIIKDTICGVDTMEDLKKIEDLMKRDVILSRYIK